jgi:hypothetical protein
MPYLPHHCTNCGYDLRVATSSDRCPECGGERRPIATFREGLAASWSWRLPAFTAALGLPIAAHRVAPHTLTASTERGRSILLLVALAAAGATAWLVWGRARYLDRMILCPAIAVGIGAVAVLAVILIGAW